MRLKRVMSAMLAAIIVVSAIPATINAAPKDLDGLTNHTTKVYDGFENQGGYARPSVSTIRSDFTNSSKNVHPRVMISKSDVTKLKNDVKDSNNPKYWWYNKLKGRADQLYNQLKGSESSQYRFKYTKCYETRMPGPQGKGNAADVFRDRMMILGMAYQITGDTKYAEAAWVMLSDVISFPDINPWHDLDFGFFCQGYAIAYDWMYDAWSADRRTALENAIKTQCFRPANDSYTNNSPSKTQTSENGLVRGVYVEQNHNPIVNSGVIMSALALMDKYPDITTSLCRDAFICLERDLNMFAPDGVTKEGMEYMLLSIDNLSMAFSSMEASLGKLYGLDTCPGLSGGKATRSVYGMESDVGSFSYGDTYDSFMADPGELYFDAHYGVHGFTTKIYNRLKTNSGNDYTRNVQILCWYKPDSNSTISFDKDMVIRGDSAFATFRSSFDAGQTFVGIKAGKTCRDYFFHLDEGSFVFSSQGVKWAVDMGKDDYNLDGYMRPKDSDNKRFKIFRLRPDAHNTLLINPSAASFGYEFEQTASMTTDISSSSAKAVINMNDLYGSKTSSAQRGFFFTDNRSSLVVRDEVTLTGSSDLYWVMYTPQNVSISGNTVTLTSKDDSSKKLKLEISSSATGKLYSESAAPWGLAPTVSGQNSNSSYTRIVFKITGAKGSVNITAKLSSASASTPAASTYGAISTWNVNGTTPSNPSNPSTTPSSPSNTPSNTPSNPSNTPSNPSNTPSNPSNAPVTTTPSNPTVTTTPSVTTEDPESQIMEFVKRNYIYVLDREPEKEGAEYWYGELYNFNRTGAEVAQGFIFSKEFNDRNTSDKEFVTILYKTFFGREPDDEGMNFWLTQLSTGKMDRFRVANGFIFSQEWADTCATYGIRSGCGIKPSVQIEPTKLTCDFVERMYTTALCRDYDEEGKAYWTNQLANFNITGETLGAEFFLSKEMVGYNLSDKEFVARLYATFMDREPDPDGEAYWLDCLKKGSTRDSVVYGFTRSREFTERCIEARILPF